VKDCRNFSRKVGLRPAAFSIPRKTNKQTYKGKKEIRVAKVKTVELKTAALSERKEKTE
jgi:hypothetical protein